MRLPHSPTAAGNSTKLPGDHNPTKALHAWSSSQPAQRSLRALARYPHFEPPPAAPSAPPGAPRGGVPSYPAVELHRWEWMESPPPPSALSGFRVQWESTRQEVFLPTRPVLNRVPVSRSWRQLETLIETHRKVSRAPPESIGPVGTRKVSRAPLTCEGDILPWDFALNPRRLRRRGPELQ